MPASNSKGRRSSLTAQAAQAIGLAIHELATNASKYGALSVSTGKVKVSWKADPADPSQILLTWMEQGGPPVQAPSHKGFGHMVIDAMIARSLNGKVAMEFAEQGFHWTVTIPASNLVASAPDHAYELVRAAMYRASFFFNFLLLGRPASSSAFARLAAASLSVEDRPRPTPDR